MGRFMGFWRTRLAFLPTRMDDGSIVWLRRFEERKVMLKDTDWLPDDVKYIVKMRRRPPERMIP